MKKSIIFVLITFFSFVGGMRQYNLIPLNCAVADDSSAVAAKDEVSNDYLLQIADVLSIEVWKDDNLTKKVFVRPDGKISFPLIGDVLAKGRSVEELRAEITQKLTEYIPDVAVTVIVNQISATAYKAYVLGKVNQPGEYEIKEDTRVIQLLSMAKGLITFASPEKIIIIRQQVQAQVKIDFNYEQFVDKGELSQNIKLKPDDVIIVP